jgi:hypothetical protein
MNDISNVYKVAYALVDKRIIKHKYINGTLGTEVKKIAHNRGDASFGFPGDADQ